MTLTELRNNVAGLEARKAVLTKSIDTLEAEQKTLEARDKLLLKACELGRLVMQGSLEAREAIESLLTQGLTEILGAECSFKLEEVFDANGSPKGFRTRVKEGEGEFDDPSDSVGSGGRAIMSICIKMAEILTFPGVPKLLVMDEPLAPLSVNFQEHFEDFVRTVCNSTDIQIIQITHQPFPFGKIYRIRKRKGVSSAEEVEEGITNYE